MTLKQKSSINFKKQLNLKLVVSQFVRTNNLLQKFYTIQSQFYK